MGMYDYLVDEKYDAQVKLFYSPVFTDDPIEQNQYTWHSGGTLTTYKKYSHLPLKTLYYEYPRDFVIVLKPSINRFEAGIVQHGQFQGFVRDAEKTEGFVSYYSDRGEQLKIQSSSNVRQYLNEYKWAYSDRNAEKIEAFKQKWTHPLTVEQKIGELYDCYQREMEMKKDERFKEFMAEDNTENIKEKIDSIKKECPTVFQRFLDKHSLRWKETSQ